MSPLYRLPPRQGALTRFLSSGVLLAILVLSFFLGLFVFLALLGMGLIAVVVLYLRFRWRRRATPVPRQGRGGVTLEGEYTVSKPPRERDR